MATAPKKFTLEDVKSVGTAKVLNGIKNELGATFANVPAVRANELDTLKAYGQAVVNYTPNRNAFIDTLVNRIGLVMFSSHMYYNHLEPVKKGYLAFGETIEEVFVDLVRVFEYDPVDAQNTLYQRQLPDVRTAFHTINFQKFYKVTVTYAMLRRAFLSWDGLYELIDKIMEAVYKSAEYDEYITAKYVIARAIVDGRIKLVTIPAVNAENASSIVSTIKGYSNNFEFLSTEYNAAGVHNNSEKPYQYLVQSANFNAIVDVEVLAKAFNMDKAEFMGNNLLIDSFDKQDTARLAELFANDPNYVEISGDELEGLANIPAVLFDRSWFQFYDNLMDTGEAYNGQSLERNVMFHTWRIFSVSPFANVVGFTTVEPEVTGVTVTPTAPTVAKGSQTQFSASVATTGFAPQTVTWSITGNSSDSTTISASGLLSVSADETGPITVTATSTYDNTKSGISTVTVSA